MKIKILLISLILLNSCYANEENKLTYFWLFSTIIVTGPTLFPTGLTVKSTRNMKQQQNDEIKEFIKRSYDKLELEIAKGEGLYLDQLIDLTKSTFESKEETIKYYREELISIINTCNSKNDRIEKLIESAMRKNK